MQSKYFIGLGIIVAVIVVAVFVVFGCDSGQEQGYKMDLEIWGVFDDSDAFTEIIKQYRKNNPQIRDIRYKKISSSLTEYQTTMVEALASDTGPDIIYFHNTWLPLHKNKVAPNPDSTNKLVPFTQNFVDVAASDFVDQNQIYAMPLDCDTLALYYNKDIFNQAGLTFPPQTWEEVISDVKLLTKFDENNRITQSAIALGRSKAPGEVNRASDILMLMMLQAGTQMNQKDSNQITFDRSYNGSDNLGQSALDYYMRFSTGSDSQAYTWNASMDHNLDSFTYGKTGMVINYSYWYQRQKERAPDLSFAVAPVPQLDIKKQVNFANYWGVAVTKDRKIVAQPGRPKPNYTNDDRVREAWKFVEYLTMRPSATGFDATANYLEQTRKPAARRDLIDAQKSDPVLGVFSQQALTAKSWQQPDSLKVEEIFTEMIDDVASGRATSNAALRTAASRVDALVKKQ